MPFRYQKDNLKIPNESYKYATNITSLTYLIDLTNLTHKTDITPMGSFINGEKGSRICDGVVKIMMMEEGVTNYPKSFVLNCLDRFIIGIPVSRYSWTFLAR